MLAVRARALLEGRFAPSIDDVLALAEPILKHRMALTFAARADGETISGVVGTSEGADRLSRWPRRPPLSNAAGDRTHGRRRPLARGDDCRV